LPADTAVECRIQVAVDPDRYTVQLAGRLNAAQVAELRHVCAAARGQLRIDLTDLLSADAVGLDALRRLRRSGAELVGAARYLRRWLS
jgi:anti-anti-sigma regulatory factor